MELADLAISTGVDGTIQSSQASASSALGSARIPENGDMLANEVATYAWSGPSATCLIAKDRW